MSPKRASSAPSCPSADASALGIAGLQSKPRERQEHSASREPSVGAASALAAMRAGPLILMALLGAAADPVAAAAAACATDGPRVDCGEPAACMAAAALDATRDGRCHPFGPDD